MKLPIKLVIVDDEKLIVSLLESFLGQCKKVNVLFTAFSGNMFLKKLKESDETPDIVLMDLRMTDKNGVETTSEMKMEYPDIKVITVSSFYKKSFMGYMLRSGVSAFVPKGITPELLLNVIIEVHEKGFYFLPEQVEVMREQMSMKTPKPYSQSNKNILSEREIDVLKLICKQMTAQEIADKLFVSKRTIDGHRNNILMKTNAKNTAGLVLYAIKNNIVILNKDQLF